MGKYKVVMIDDVFSDTKVEEGVLKEINADIVLRPSHDEDVAIQNVSDTDAIITDCVPVTERILEAAKRCRIVAGTAVGYDNIDILAAARRGIYVTNAPSNYWCADEVSDHALALMLAIQRKVTFFNQKMKEGEWKEILSKTRPIFSLRGQIYGLVGFGGIARIEAKKAQAFGFHVIATDPIVGPREANQCGVELVDFDRLLRTSDVISIHAPLSNSTYHMFNEETIEKMKNTAYLINTARGPIVDQKALHNALKSGKIAGAALDVFEHEPPKANEPLFTLDNVIVTPHVAFFSETAIIKARSLACREIIAVLKGGQPINWVNRKEMMSVD